MPTCVYSLYCNQRTKNWWITPRRTNRSSISTLLTTFNCRCIAHQTTIATNWRLRKATEAHASLSTKTFSALSACGYILPQEGGTDEAPVIRTRFYGSLNHPCSCTHWTLYLKASRILSNTKYGVALLVTRNASSRQPSSHLHSLLASILNKHYILSTLPEIKSRFCTSWPSPWESQRVCLRRIWEGPGVSDSSWDQSYVRAKLFSFF